MTHRIVFANGVSRIFRLTGTLSGDDTAKVLHTLLLSLFIWNGIWTVALLPYSTGHPPQLTVLAIFEGSLATALMVLRRGSLRTASRIYLVGVWLFATAVVALNTGIRSPVLSLYVTLPVSAAWLLGRRSTLWATAVCLGSALAFAVLEMKGIQMPGRIPATAIGIWIQLAGAVLMGVVPLSHILRVLTNQFETLRRQHEELRESEQRFRVLADTAPVFIGVAGIDKQARFFNRAWLEFRGRKMEQELGYGWTDGLSEGDRAAALNQDFRLPSTQEGRTFECRVSRADGECRSLLCTVTAREGRSGVGYVGSAIDITDMKRAQEEAFATQKLSTLGTLASGIAHDFNNILAGVMAQTEMAQSEMAAGSPAEDALRAITDLVLRGSAVVRELMVYAGKESETLEDVDLSALVRDIAPFLKSLVSKHASLELDVQQTGTVRASPAKLRRVVMNLVTNASDAIEDRDGAIRIATRHVVLSQDVAGERKLRAGDYVQLQVSDTGCGILPSNQPRIFDPFFTTKTTGRGLGLAVVDGVVRSLRGQIQLTSEPDKGTTFEIVLPRGGPQSEPNEAPVVEKQKGSDPVHLATILVVEDEDLLRQAVSKMLRKAGSTVIEACDGSAAAKMIRSHPDSIHVLLLDVTLPGTPSREILQQARRLRPQMKVIVTSAYSEDIACDKLQGAGDLFVRKPYQFGKIIESLRRVLS